MNKPKPVAVAPGTAEKLSNKNTTMKTLTKIALSLVLLATAASSRADWVDGYTRVNGTYVSGHARTAANNTPYDNYSYRGYPSQQPGYVSPRPSYGYETPRTLPSYDFNQNVRPLRRNGYGF